MTAEARAARRVLVVDDSRDAADCLAMLLELPDARSPAELGLSQDRRRLAIALLGLRFAQP